MISTKAEQTQNDMSIFFGIYDQLCLDGFIDGHPCFLTDNGKKLIKSLRIPLKDFKKSFKSIDGFLGINPKPVNEWGYHKNLFADLCRIYKKHGVFANFIYDNEKSFSRVPHIFAPVAGLLCSAFDIREYCYGKGYLSYDKTRRVPNPEKLKYDKRAGLLNRAY
ncbi:MAG: hypothetical protein KJ559_03565 [Nanoarchaeota archaeon]|nr:hypothetical protein [Nanoarchaeota archaeon]